MRLCQLLGGLLLSGVLVVSLSACADRQAPALRTPAEAATADSAVALLVRADDAALRQAFENVSSLRHARYMRTDQFDEGGLRLAYQEHVVHFGEGDAGGRGGELVQEDSSGMFDFGYARRFVSRAPDPVDPAGLPGYILPDDPAYATQRDMEAYRYHIIGDTTLHGRAVRLVRASALPGTGDDQAIRRAHVYLEERTDRIVGIYIERIERALWLREESALFASVERLPSGSWVPKQTRFETLIKLPFRPSQRFRSSTSYYSFERASASSER
jgi:hypothetical protein